MKELFEIYADKTKQPCVWSEMTQQEKDTWSAEVITHLMSGLDSVRTYLREFDFMCSLCIDAAGICDKHLTTGPFTNRP